MKAFKMIHAKAFKMIHASGRFDGSALAFNHDVARYVSDGASLISHTEQDRDTVQRLYALRVPGYSYARLESGPGRSDECALQWRNDTWSLDGDLRTEQLSDQTYYSANGVPRPLVRALVVPLRHASSDYRRVSVIVVHMPTRNTARRRAVWRSVCAGLRKLVQEIRGADPSTDIIIAADWNIDLKTKRGREELYREILTPLRLHHNWTGAYPNRWNGTHGRRVIDAIVTDLAVEHLALYPKTKASDHRAFSARLTI